jgi:hypothetical protein
MPTPLSPAKQRHQRIDLGDDAALRTGVIRAPLIKLRHYHDEMRIAPRGPPGAEAGRLSAPSSIGDRPRLGEVWFAITRSLFASDRRNAS